MTNREKVKAVAIVVAFFALSLTIYLLRFNAAIL